MSESYSLTKQDIELIAEAGRKNFYFFCHDILGKSQGFEDIQEVPHRELCNHAQTWNKSKKLTLTPRDTFKTTVLVVAYALWEIIRDKNISILLTSDTMKNSIKSLATIKQVIEKHEFFRICYGDLVGEAPWSDTQICVKGRTISSRAYTIEASGADASLVGSHYKLILFDDPHNQKNINTPEQILKIIEYYKGLMPLLDSKDGRLSISATRWHHMDIENHILVEEKDNFDILIRAAYWEEDGETKYFFPNRLTKEFLDKRKIEIGTYFFACTPKETPILMSDFTTKPISEIVPGDEIVGYSVWDGEKQRRLIKTKVTEINSRLAMVYDYEMESGRKVRCTEDHNWFTGRSGNDKGHPVYKPAKVGSRLMFVCLPEPIEKEKESDYRYLAGIIDGEGSVIHGSIFIHQSEKVNMPVCKAIEDTLKKLGLKYTSMLPKGKDGVRCWWINEGINGKIKILHNCRLGKSEALLKNIYKHSSGKFVQEKDLVKKISNPTFERVYALTTESGNYVAWGYASKNCQYLNDPCDDETAVFKHSYFKAFAINQDKILYKSDPTDKDYKSVIITNLRFFASIDPAGRGNLTEQRRLDYTGWVVVGVSPDNEWFIFEAGRKKGLKPSDIIELIFRLHYNYENVIIGVEDVTWQGQLKEGAIRASAERGVWPSVRELQHNNRNKGQRIKGLQPIYESGYVYHIKGLYDLENELLKWSPNSTIHDDVIDALAYVNDIAFKPRRDDVPRQRVFEPTKSPGFMIEAQEAWEKGPQTNSFMRFLEEYEPEDVEYERSSIG